MTPDTMRVLTYPVRGRHGTSYKAEVKGPGTRVYVGTFGSEAEARGAGDTFLRTGRKPRPAKRGPKGSRNEKWDDVPRVVLGRITVEKATGKVLAVDGKPTPHAKPAHRLAMIAAIARRLA